MLSLELVQQSSVPLEVEGITPDRLRALSIAEIEQLPIFQGNRELPLAEFFRARGNPAAEAIAWSGDLSGVHWIGAKMTSGAMHIESSCGRHVGSEMRGGSIVVHGDVGDYVGAEMHGGSINVAGDAGDQVAAAYRGSAVGMTRGTILIEGSAGHEVGQAMRRGLIAIGGDCGDFAGFNMLAGTILLFRNVGIRHGAGMRRGSIGFFGEAPQMLPTFRHGCRFRTPSLGLIAQQLRGWKFSKAAELNNATVDLYNGDFLEGGRGELLVRVA